MRKRWVPGVMLLTVAATLSTSALATPEIQKQFTTVCKPKAGTALEEAMCKACHLKVGDKVLNAFGKDVGGELKKQKSKAFTAAVWAKVGTKDSDKDGAGNKAEVGKGTLPADPKSK